MQPVMESVTKSRRPFPLSLSLFRLLCALQRENLLITFRRSDKGANDGNAKVRIIANDRLRSMYRRNRVYIYIFIVGEKDSRTAGP